MRGDCRRTELSRCLIRPNEKNELKIDIDGEFPHGVTVEIELVIFDFVEYLGIQTAMLE
jgi:hypothetical protein